MLAELRESAGRLDHERAEKLAWFHEAKVYMAEQFEIAERLGRPAPDTMHPAHVQIVGGEVHFRGPIQKRERVAWEWLKAAIHVAACLDANARTEFGRSGSPYSLEQLNANRKHRRWLMRRVPKGWNWREEIYCRDSQLDFAKQVTRDLREAGYVATRTLN